MTTIYTLSHPVTADVFYVGQTQNPKKRFKYYLSQIDYRPVQEYVNMLMSNGLTPIMGVLDEVEKQESDFWEVYWIAQMKAWGARLKNVSIGGKGPRGMRHTDSVKRKISEASMQMWNRTEIRENYIKHVQGLNNANADRTVYDFWHEEHGHISCTMYELRTQHIVSASKLSAVVNGKRFQSCGWRMAANKEKRNPKHDNSEHEWIGPNGERFVGRKVDLLAAHPELDQTALCRLISGKYASHKGWTIAAQRVLNASK